MQPDLSSGAFIAIGVLALIQVILDIVAIVDLVRRPEAGVTGGNKWLWLAAILVVSILGALAYLAIGRRGPLAVDPAPAARTAGQARTTHVADTLYGPRDDAR